MTIAEIFILLLFLLLLIGMLSYAGTKPKEEEPEKNTEETSLIQEDQKISELRVVEYTEEIKQEPETSEHLVVKYTEVHTLVASKEEKIVELIEEKEHIKNESLEQIVVLEKELQEIKEEKDFSESEVRRLNQALQDVSEATDNEIQQRREMEEQVQELEEELLATRQIEEQTQRKIQTLQEKSDVSEQEIRNQNAEMEVRIWALEEGMKSAQQQRDEFAQQLAMAQQEASQAKQNLQVMTKKGHNPPCWYKVVPDGKGGVRERPHYTFFVAVFDNSMVFQLPPIPPGSADDDDGSEYSFEATQLGLYNFPYNSPLDNESVERYFRPIHDAGKSSKVRSYSCTFFIKVWDKTSENAKDRWKDAHNRILESMFGTYVVNNDPWPEKSA